MSHITKQERHGLEELFVAIEQQRYGNRLKMWQKVLKNQLKRHKFFIHRFKR